MQQGGWAQQTAAGPAPGVVFGGFWIRFVAYILDIIIIGIVYAVVAAVSASLALLVYIGAIAYFVLCWGFLGQTIGMMPFGLRIVRNSDGGKLTWSNVALRMVGWVVSGIVLDIGFIWAAFDARKRGWHDMIGGTVVIKNA
jgi:uncharacterized RDD family membrane protein YckC